MGCQSCWMLWTILVEDYFILYYIILLYHILLCHNILHYIYIYIYYIYIHNHIICIHTGIVSWEIFLGHDALEGLGLFLTHANSRHSPLPWKTVRKCGTNQNSIHASCLAFSIASCQEESSSSMAYFSMQHVLIKTTPSNHVASCRALFSVCNFATLSSAKRRCCSNCSSLKLSNQKGR